MSETLTAAVIEPQRRTEERAVEKLLERLRGRRWALVTDDLVALLDVVRRIDTPPSVVLVSPCHHLFAQAEFPTAQVGTHPNEVRSCSVELALLWRSKGAPEVRPCRSGDRFV